MSPLVILNRRLAKLGIQLEYIRNSPWIYLVTVNGNVVTERFEAEHGFTIAWEPIRPGQQLKFTDLKEIFKIIRKYRTT